MKKSKSKKHKPQKHSYLWLFIFGFGLSFGLLYCEKNVDETYMELYPYNNNWQNIGKGTVIKYETARYRKYRGRNRSYYGIYCFEWCHPHNVDEKHTGICYLPLSVGTDPKEKPKHAIGTTVEVLVYGNNHSVSKISGMYITPTTPTRFLSRFSPLVFTAFMYVFFVIMDYWDYFYHKKDGHKKKKSRVRNEGGTPP